MKRIQELNAGLVESQNLAEGLAVDFAKLFAAVYPHCTPENEAHVKQLRKLGIAKRMEAMGTFVLELDKGRWVKIFGSHPSDTVRGWAAYAIGATPNTTLPRRLEAIMPFADDTHFGVREWAWMAVRKQIASDLGLAIRHLSQWAAHPSPRVRRFASEATRPCGVWCEHIGELKQNPAQGLPILSQLCCDADRYVQNSVGNWLNDASKSKPQWVKQTTGEWLKKHPGPATEYIVKRGLRTLEKKRKKK